MRKIYTLILLLLPTISFCHSGAAGDPFTALGQARGVTAAGIYYFNLGGVTFNTYVDINGYVRIALDFGNGTGDLPQGTSLATGSRGILNPTVLASLTSISQVRISSSTGNIDVTTTNATIISRVKTNYTLHRGTADNSYNSSWTGHNATYITSGATGCTNTLASLQQNIVHVCGNTNGFHWIPNGDKQREVFNIGEIPDAASFSLWVIDGNYSLPVNLLNFNTNLIDHGNVKLSWETSSELNNRYFVVERSEDGKLWNDIVVIDGAGNSSQHHYYHYEDYSPTIGYSYYRLKLIDFNGQSSYSKINEVGSYKMQNSQIYIYPNPSSNYVTVEGNNIQITDIKIFNSMGDDITSLVPILSQNQSSILFNLSTINPGVYSIRTISGSKKIYKQ